MTQSSQDTIPSEQKLYFWQNASPKERALFFEHLGNLVEGGVTVLAAIASFLEKTTNPFLYVWVSELLMFVESGDSMSIGMKKIPKLFDRTEVAIVEAGEQSGGLQKSFINIAKDLRDRNEIASKVKSALTYPIVIVCFLIGAIVTVMTYVIPKLLPLFTSSGTELPFITQTLVWTSEFFGKYLVLLIILAIAAFLFVRAYIATPNGMRKYHTILLSTPALGMLYRNYLVVRVSSVLGLLLSAGIPIVKTLRLVGESTGNILFQEALTRVADGVEKGHKLTESFEEADTENRIFPRDMIQLIGAGEKTSTVNKVAFKISEQYSREVDASISILVKLVEPIALLFSGAFVLWFAFAIFSAVLKVTETVGG